MKNLSCHGNNIISFCKLVFFLIIIILNSVPIFAQRRISLRLASPLPENSPVGRILDQAASDIERITNGDVQLIVYHYGVAGDELDVVRKLRGNQIQAALLSDTGLYESMPELSVFQYPFLFRNNNEVELALQQIRNSSTLQSSGFITLVLSQYDWCKIFSQRIWSSRDRSYSDPDLNYIKQNSTINVFSNLQNIAEALTIMGFQVNRISDFKDVSSGGSDVIITTTGIMSIHRNYINYIFYLMQDINVAPALCGILINRTAWIRIPDRYKPQIIDIFRTVESQFMDIYITNISDSVNNQETQTFYNEHEIYENRLVGTIFDRTYFQIIKNAIQDYRR